MPLTVDLDSSATKLGDMERYFAENVWNSTDQLVCHSRDMCRTSAMKRPDTSFHEGQGQMVGPYFDLAVDEKPLRVLVIPMEFGSDESGISFTDRTSNVADMASQKQFQQLNPHMRGVVFTLQLAYGLPAGESGANVLNIEGHGEVHLFKAYAMVNLLWCSAVRGTTMSSRSTGLMRASCSRHMRATIDILKPTLVISQGSGLDETLRASLGVREPVNPHIAECELDGNKFVWASLRHPTLHWHSTKYTYFRDVVAPTIGEARDRALALQ